MERKKVFYLINSLRADGGAEIALMNIVNSLDYSCFEVWVGSLFKDGSLRERLALENDKVVCFDFKHRFYTDLNGIWRLVCFIKQHRIDIVHTHLFAANTVGRVAAAIAKTPVIITTEHNTYYSRKRFYHFFIDWVLSQVTTQMIAVSEAVKEAVVKQSRISQNRFVIIYNPLLLEEVPILSKEEQQHKREILGIQADQPVVISIGRLTPQKGFHILLQAASLVQQQIPNAIFLIVGGGEMEADLRYICIQLGLNTYVNFLGVRQDIYELIQISDVLAMPSLWEGLGMVLLEAGACKVPVVASAVGGVLEVISNRVNGLLVPVEDSKELAEKIVELLIDPQLRMQMGEAGRTCVEERFSCQVVTQKLQNLYKKVLF